MSDRLETLRLSRCGNRISSGRQIPRTPPMTSVRKQLEFSEPEETTQAPDCNPDADPTNKHSPAINSSFTGAATLQDMLKGMKGYEVTPSDLEFIKKMKEEQLVKKLQGDLLVVQKQLKNETMALELANASREMALDELNKFPSCEDLTKWATVVHRKTSPLTEVEGLDLMSLLAGITLQDVDNLMVEKKKRVDQLKKRAAKKQKADKREQLEKQIACEELKIRELMKQLAELKSELLQQKAEVCNSLKKPEDLEEHGGGEEVKLCENSKPATIRGPSTRSKPKTIRSKQTSTKDASGMRPEEKQRKPRSSSESTTLRPAPGERKMEEGEESERVERRRRKPAGAAPKTASQAEDIKKETSETLPASRSRRRGAAEGPAPRRSKRIASKK
ncbi:proton pump-interactor BIP103 [Nematolebias whitei]|uniref:proton pump-interactor BIP103 n=1 Tax=Nematolebias whitei TaxID=451745 RepID=UPI001896FB72|nr:proton pump-interactor BIP103 [Nematolebias whitei]